jgi:hypothetical protein
VAGWGMIAGLPDCARKNYAAANRAFAIVSGPPN